LGWKMLLPAGLVNVFLSGALILWDPTLRSLAVVGLLEIGALAVLTLLPPARDRGPRASDRGLPAASRTLGDSRAPALTGASAVHPD
jgi:NADH-quinone oxidoreductase subunit H